MTLYEFFELHEDAPVMRAFDALRQSLNRHVTQLPATAYSPWTLRLGKGGPKPDGGYYDSAEQSLYRHCMEVAVFAAWLFYHAWQAERPPFSSKTDVVVALRTLFGIAFAHDADKLLDTRSKSPGLEEVQTVYEQLDIGAWTDLTVVELHHAVSLVENRGQGQALFGSTRIDPVTQKLAELVHEGDNLLSRVARQGGTARAFLELFNQDLARLHRLYAVPDQPLRLLRVRHHPIVLYRLQNFLAQQLVGDSGFYPLVFVRRGEWLELSIAEEMDVAAWLDRFEVHLAGSEPSLKVAATTGTVTWFGVGNAEDLIAAVRNESRQAPLLLRVTAKDWETVAPLVKFWVMQAGGPCSTTPLKGKLCPVVKTSGAVPFDHPFWRAACLTAVMLDRPAAERLLDAQQGVVRASLQRNGIVPTDLDSLSLRTIAALQASLSINTDLPALLNSVQGEWPRLEADDPGASAIVQRLKDQLGLSDSTSQAPGYLHPARGGTCLLCGAATEQVIESSRMKLAGVKASSFSNRIGHIKHLWSEKGENFVCPACLKIQGLLLETYPSLRSAPLLIATPVRHLLDTRTGDRQKGVLRSFDAISKDNWQKVLPWEADARCDEPLLFEERVTALDEVIDQMYRLACYAALSGEPVHAFIASQRECKAAFLYEGMPELIKELLNDLMNEDSGIGRKYIERLVRRLELFKTMFNEYEGVTGMQALPRFGWWAVAFVLFRALSRANDRDRERLARRFFGFVEFARQEYPMSNYDDDLEILVTRAAETHRPKKDASGAEWTLMPRIALETYQKHYVFGPTATQDAITERLRADLSRRYGADLYQKDLDERLHAFAEAAFKLFAKAEQEFDLESSFIRFFLAAYEGGLRRTIRERWKNRESSEKADTAIETATQSSLSL